MKYIAIIFCMACLACNTNNQPDTSTVSSTDTVTTVTDTIAVTEDISGCYMQVIKRDTIMASLQQQGNEVSGTLTFDNFEKDGSSGVVKGTKEKNILRLLYSFQSEGMNSVMEVMFKIENNKLYRGVGDIQTRGDTAFFSNPSGISFPGSTVLEKVNCATIKH